MTPFFRNPTVQTLKKTALLLLAAGIFLLPACKPPVSPKINATDTGKNGPGAQTIKGGDVTMSFSADGKPVSFTRGNGTNLINTQNPGKGFYLTTGAPPDEKTIPITSLESKDGNLILTAADESRFTLAVNAGNSYISLRLLKVENVPKGSEPVLRLQATFNNICPFVVPLDYMVGTGDVFYARGRTTMNISWPFLWIRGGNDPLGGVAFFVPLHDDDHNESLLRLWTEEKMPHPKIKGEWTYERAKAWVDEWKQKFANTHTLSLSAEKPEDLEVLFDYAKKWHVDRLYLHTDTWRGAYWVYDRDPLSVNKKVFPRGEADLKAFQDKLKANGMDAMLQTLCYGFGPEGSKYIGKGKKTDRRLANWGKGQLEKPISETDTTILFRPNPGVVFPTNDPNLPWPKAYPHFFSIGEVLIGDEIIPCKFENTDKDVWTLKVQQRGASPAKYQAGTEVIGLLKAYNQNYYPDSRTDLLEITAKEYADFFNRMGIDHNEFDGGECHQDIPWGFAKWTMFVYQNTDHPMTSNTSGGGPNPWDMVYRFKSDGAYIINKRGGGYAAMTLHREGRPATNPIENHFTLADAAAANSTGFSIKKPEPMFGIFPKTIQEHGLADLIANQFSTWREVAPLLTPELRKQISESYFYDRTPFPLDPGPPIATTLFEARKTDGGYEVQPFCVMSRVKEDAEWRTVQEYGALAPRQYIGTGMRLRLENPFGRQTPQFIIRVLNGYTDGYVSHAPTAPKEEFSKDMQGYLIGAGASPDHIAATPAATPAPYPADPAAALMMQPKVGFARVPVNTQAKVLIENLRLVGNTPSSIKNPVIHTGAGTLRIEGEVKTNQYLWYQGGDTVGLYDLNWKQLAKLPAKPENFEIEKNFNEFWIDGEAANPAPWFDVQFIAKGESVPLKK